MRREQRLRRKKDFAAAYKHGRVFGNHLLVLRVRHNEEPEGVTRFGFVTGKTVGNAVARNGVKRRLREAARSVDAKAGLDIVVGARKTASEADFSKLKRALIAVMSRADALESNLITPPVPHEGTEERETRP